MSLGSQPTDWACRNDDIFSSYMTVDHTGQIFWKTGYFGLSDVLIQESWPRVSLKRMTSSPYLLPEQRQILFVKKELIESFNKMTEDLRSNG